MRPARRLVLVATALATTALTAPTAIAQNDVEVLGEEHTIGQEEVHHCPPVALSNHVVTGGCVLHASGGSGMILVQHNPDTETVITSCDSEFTVRIGEDGLGYITNAIFSGTSCLWTQCDEAAPSHASIPWPAGLFETGAAGDEQEVLVSTLCLRAPLAQEGAVGSPCTLIFEVSSSGHQSELQANDAPCIEGNGVEFTGHWFTEGVGFETVHLD
jgi:hypothetical protein